MNDLTPRAMSRFAPGAALARLRPLLAPDSIAVIGATPREGAFGQVALRTIVASGFRGRVLPVNPKYDDIAGLPCHPSLAALPERPDLAVIVVDNAQVEAALEEVIGSGVPAAAVFASCYLEGDTPPLLTERIRRKARAAGLAMVGANCLGFQNREHPLAVGVFPAGDLGRGNIAVISHSGSAYHSMSTLDARFRPNLIVSAGQELATTAADYLAYALDLASTRVVAMFLETVRDPAGFAAALARAETQDMPVVALKVGKTEASARLAQTHSGALAGNDAAYAALFDHYGVRRVESIDELTATALLLSSPHRYVRGGLGAVLDSGGQRGMMLDLAAKLGVPVAEIAPATAARLATVLDYGLEPVNPVDAWGTGRNSSHVFGSCYRALADDPSVGLVAVFSDLAIEDPIAVEILDSLVDAAAATDKPMFAVLNWSRCFAPKFLLRAIERGVPVLDGIQNALAAMGHAVTYAHRRARSPGAPAPAPDERVIARWRTRLGEGRALAEHEALTMVADFGVPTIPWRLAKDEGEAKAAAAALGFPVALKTAEGLAHKTEVGGVHLGLTDGEAVARAWRDLRDRIGPRVLVMPMAEPGVEMALGIVVDAQFGPLVMVGAGGILVEAVPDRAYLLGATDTGRATAAIDRLQARRLLAGVRGRPAADVAALARAAVALGAMAMALADQLAEVDVNPLIVTAKGAVAVDALVVPAASG